MKKILFVSVLAFFVYFIASAEQITITTYYPAPYGVYKDLQAETLRVLNNGNLILAGSDPNQPSLKLIGDDGPKNPYILFDDDGSGAKGIIALKDNDILVIGGGTVEFANEINVDGTLTPAVIKTGEVWFCSSLPGT